MNKIGLRLQLYLKRDSGIVAFLWNLQTFSERFFYRTPQVDASVAFFINFFEDLRMSLGLLEYFPFACLFSN